MKNIKGFTLIELLAVIVILAIIALIATPIILGIIDDARKSAKDRTAELVANGVQLAYTRYLFKNNGSGSPDQFCTYMVATYFDMDKATLDSNGCAEGSTSVVVNVGKDKYTVEYNKDKKTATVKGDKDSSTADVTDVVVNLGSVVAGAGA